MPRDLLKRVSEPKQSSLSTFLSRFLWDLSSPSFCTIKGMTGMEVREGKEVSLMETPLHALSGTFWGSRGLRCLVEKGTLSSLLLLREQPSSKGWSRDRMKGWSGYAS